MTSIAMNQIAQWIIRFRWLPARRYGPFRSRRPDIGRLNAYLRRDVGLGPDAEG